jgi:hypothetical protein
MEGGRISLPINVNVFFMESEEIFGELDKCEWQAVHGRRSETLFSEFLATNHRSLTTRFS